MRTVFLVPWRTDKAHREKLWKWCRRRWEAEMPDIPIYEGPSPAGAFNRSAAINAASRLADIDGLWDVAVVIDADVFLDTANVRAAIQSAAEGRVTWAHLRWRELSEEATERVTGRRPMTFPSPLDRERMDLLVHKTNAASWSCCVAIPRATFDAIGGFDERFVGWGYEDHAFRTVVCALYPWDRIRGDLYTLFHERSSERIPKGQSRAYATPEYLRNSRLGRRYMIAALRDHGLSDQEYWPAEPLSDALRKVHIRNLTLDDGQSAMAQTLRERRPWDGFWPTLEELRDSWKERRPIAAFTEEPEPAPAPRGITLVVRSGGEAGQWAERRDYLERSLASLVENVSGPIVQSVIYSDWDVGRNAEIAAMGERFGFYVVGDGHYGYSTGMGRLFGYLRRRARGEFVFMAEDDFVYEHPVDLQGLIDVLDVRPQLTQVALLRHPAYQSEIDRGGVLGWPLETFEPKRLNGHRWLEHRNFWTANPSLFRRSLADREWPVHRLGAKGSEERFGAALFRDTKVVSGFWGDGTPQIRHIGDVRAGAGY